MCPFIPQWWQTGTKDSWLCDLLFNLWQFGRIWPTIPQLWHIGVNCTFFFSSWGKGSIGLAFTKTILPAFFWDLELLPWYPKPALSEVVFWKLSISSKAFDPVFIFLIALLEEISSISSLAIFSSKTFFSSFCLSISLSSLEFMPHQNFILAS